MKSKPNATAAARGATSADQALPGALRAHDGTRLHVHHWPVDRPKGTMQLIHGMGEHAGRFDELARLLNQAGWAAAAIDHRGHGRSEGPRGALKHAHDLLHDQALLYDAIARAYPDRPRVVLGSSMGGAVAARLSCSLSAAEAGEPWARPLHGAILAAPALQPTMSITQRALLSSLGRLVPDLAVPAGFRHEWITTNPEVLHEIETDPLLHEQLTPRLAQFLLDSGEAVFARAKQWTVPTLMLYSTADRLVMPAGCERFVRQAPAHLVRAHVYDHLAHDLLHEPDRQRVFAHLLNWLAALKV